MIYPNIKKLATEVTFSVLKVKNWPKHETKLTGGIQRNTRYVSIFFMDILLKYSVFL